MTVESRAATLFGLGISANPVLKSGQIGCFRGREFVGFITPAIREWYEQFGVSIDLPPGTDNIVISTDDYLSLTRHNDANASSVEAPK